MSSAPLFEVSDGYSSGNCRIQPLESHHQHEHIFRPATATPKGTYGRTYYIIDNDRIYKILGF